MNKWQKALHQICKDDSSTVSFLTNYQKCRKGYKKTFSNKKVGFEELINYKDWNKNLNKHLRATIDNLKGCEK